MSFSFQNIEYALFILFVIYSEQSGILECLAESIRPCINNVTHMFYDVNNFRSVIESVCKNETRKLTMSSVKVIHGQPWRSVSK